MLGGCQASISSPQSGRRSHALPFSDWSTMTSVPAAIPFPPATRPFSINRLYAVAEARFVRKRLRLAGDNRGA